MDQNLSRHHSNQVIRVSFLWLLIGTLIILLLGLAGGILANQLWPTPQAPLTNESDQFVTTVQEVKISPNQAATDIITTANRSIVGLKAKNSPANALLAVGVVATNDGLIVTSASLPQTDLVAIDWQGAEISLNLVGADELFGLTYYRLEQGLLSPLDIRSDPVPAGNELLLLTRSRLTGLIHADTFRVNEQVLPPESAPAGIQRLLKSKPTVGNTVPGEVLLDEETKLAGLVTNSPASLAIDSTYLLASLQRVATGKREVNPLRELGLNVRYAFLTNSTDGRKFIAQVNTVLPGSPAQKAGLKRQDQITAINDNELSWNTPLTNQLDQHQLNQITLIRNNHKITIDVQP